MPGKHGTPEERFWRHVIKHDDGCWEWTGSTNKDGYGQFKVKAGESPVRASRFSWELHHGLIPDGLKVLHHCDNPPCTNPECLFLGTQGDNVADMHAKGRAGPQKLDQTFTLARRKMTDGQVAEIRQIYRRGEASARELGREFGVHHTTIVRIARGIHFPHLP